MSVFHDIRHLSPEELSDLYEIDIHPDGRVKDTISGNWFDTLAAWANYEDEQGTTLDSGETMEKFHRGGEYWD